MARAAYKRRKRERTLGQAIGLALGVTLGVALLYFGIVMLFPGSALHQLYTLIHYNSSATLRGSALFIHLMEQVEEQEALLAMPLSLLCGGLTLGRMAPLYATRRRVLQTAAGFTLGLTALCLLFLWTSAILEQATLNANEGGQQHYVGAPLYVIGNQLVWGLIWTAVCVFGAWLGLQWRTRLAHHDTPAPALKAARR